MPFALSVSKSHYTDRVIPLLYDVAFSFWITILYDYIDFLLIAETKKHNRKAVK